MKVQEISFNGEVKCVTAVPYPTEVISSMKKGGYKVKEYDLDEKEDKKSPKKTK